MKRVQRYYVYVLSCADGSLYTGITTDLARRLAEHRAGTASRYTRAKKALVFVHTESVRGRSRALRREAEIKRWSKQKKLALVQSRDA